MIREFAEDLIQLHPLSKLKGINENESSRFRLPNLETMTEQFSDELVVVIDELLNPESCDIRL